MLLDRTVAPHFQTIQTVKFPAPKSYRLDNGQPLYLINLGTQPVVRLEVLFEAGNWQEKHLGVSFFTLKMLSEGTTTKTSTQINEAFDQIGAFVELSHTPDRSNIIVYSLKKHLTQVLAIVADMLQNATFPEKEWIDLKNITLQNLRVNLEKNTIVASYKLKEALFGKTHPYGWSQNEEDINKIQQHHLQEFYKDCIKNQPFRVFISGQVAEDEVKEINAVLGKIDIIESKAEDKQVLAYHAEEFSRIIIEDKADSVQSSIRVGRKLFTRNHPDIYKFVLANEVLGGYFGSRLMKNIREDKGHTYSISSSLIPLRKEGYWLIGTDVKKEFRENTIVEIKKEINKLQTELIADSELDIVKNYIAGSFAGSLNTPFEIADRVRLMVLENLDINFFTDYIKHIRQVSAEDIQQIANKYWQWKDLQQVLVG